MSSRQDTRILITEPARHDLDVIERYIAANLRNKSAANDTVDGILSEISDLGYYPLMHPLVNDEFLSALEIRMSWFRNYNIFYGNL